MVPEPEWVVMDPNNGWVSMNMKGSMSGNDLSTNVYVYPMQGEVMVNLVKMMDPRVHSGEMMSRYDNIKRKPIIMSGE